MLSNYVSAIFGQQKGFAVSPREKPLSVEERCQKILPVATISAAMSQKRGQREDRNHKYLIPSPLPKNAGIYIEGD